MTKNTLVENEDLQSSVIEFVKSKIIERSIQQGSEVKVEELANYLQISQSLARESLQYLVKENIISSVKDKNYYIKEYNAKDIFEIYSLRSVLEGLAISLATQKASTEQIGQLEEIYRSMKLKLKDNSIESIANESSKIHAFIFEMSGHGRLIKMNRIISLQVLIANSLSGAIYTKNQEVNEHRELIGAIKSRDSDTAENVMKNHIYRSYKNFIHNNSNGFYRNSFKAMHF